MTALPTTGLPTTGLGAAVRGGGFTLLPPVAGGDRDAWREQARNAGHPLQYPAQVAPLPAAARLVQACAALPPDPTWAWLIEDDRGQVTRIPAQAAVRPATGTPGSGTARTWTPDPLRPTARQALPALDPARLISPLGPVLNIHVNREDALVSAQLASQAAGQRVYGVGRTGDHRSAATVALLEALERQAGLFDLGGAPRREAAFENLSGALDPRQTGLPAPTPECAPFDPAEPRLWLQGYDHHTGAPVWVEEHLVYYHRGTRRPWIANNSSGCAVGRTPEEAVAAAFLEVVERHAALRWWYGLTRARRAQALQVDAVTAATLTALGYRVDLYDIAPDLPVPVVLGVARQDRWDGRYPATLCVIAAGRDWHDALTACLQELRGAAMPLTPDEQRRAEWLTARPQEVLSLDDHRLAYVHPERRAVIDRRLEGAVTADLTPPPPLRTLADLHELTRGRCGLISVDQTTPVLADLQLTCVRVVCPGLLPMHYGHRYARHVPGLPVSADPHPFA
ncbi:YcaO-like family protein [Deinococcus sp.]|uniref:YcaO-like family protein n=1 Tax=Deinococcus sp. TaxID=47478 RepID=UPI00391C2587